MRNVTILLAVAAMLALAGSAWADTYDVTFDWNTGDGNWTSTASWTKTNPGPGTPPGPLPFYDYTEGSDTYRGQAYIANNGAIVTINSGTEADPVGAFGVTLGDYDHRGEAVYLGHIDMTAGYLKVAGYQGGLNINPDCTFTQSGGTVDLGYLNSGSYNWSGGFNTKYTLEGGTFKSDSIAGGYWRSNFTQTGGEMSVGTFGLTDGGSYNLSGGTATVNKLEMGASTAADGTTTLNITSPGVAPVLKLKTSLQFGDSSADVDYAVLNAPAGQVINMVCNQPRYASEDPGDGLGYRFITSTTHFRNYLNDNDVENDMDDLNNVTLAYDISSAYGAYCWLDVQVGVLEVGGYDNGAATGGLVDNFALKGLTLTPYFDEKYPEGGGRWTGPIIQLVDDADNGNRASNECLYVENLAIGSGSVLDLNGLTLYYLEGEASDAFLADGRVVDNSASGGGDLVQIFEPVLAHGVLANSIRVDSSINYDGTVETGTQTAVNYTQLPVTATVEHESGGTNMRVMGQARSYYDADGIHHVVRAAACGDGHGSDLCGTGTLTDSKTILVTSGDCGYPTGTSIWATGTLTLNGLLKACRHEGEGFPDATGLAAIFNVRIIRTAPGADVVCFNGTISLLGNDDVEWVQVVLAGDLNILVLQQVAAGLVIADDFAYLELDHVDVGFRIPAVIGQAFDVDTIFYAEAFVPDGAEGLGAEVVFGESGELTANCHTPEPTTIAMLLTGGLITLRRRRKNLN